MYVRDYSIKQIEEAKTMKIYVYQDIDNNELEIFASFIEAETYAKLKWGHDPQWENCYNNSWQDTISDYVTIFERTL